jgi:hypothetical protein
MTLSRNSGASMLDAMRQLVQLIRSAAADRQTLDELLVMIDDRGRWRNGHALFDRIRDKTLKAERGKDGKLEAQYLFEEVCAKTLYNMAGEPAPFDAHSPYWIVPNALRAAKKMGIETSRVVAIVAG